MTMVAEARIAIAASAGDVYRALTDESALQRWFAEHVSIDLDEGRYEFWGRYTPGAPERGELETALLEASSPVLLCYSWRMGERDSEVEIALDEDEDGTLLSLRHRNLGPQETAWVIEAFWSTALENLRAYVERGSSGARFDFSEIPTGDVELAIDIEADPATVFDALINPAQLDRYMSGDGGATVEPRAGGVYDVGWPDDGPVQIIDLIPNQRLSYSWKPHDDEAGPTVVTWELEGSSGRTRLTLVHSGFAPDRKGLDFGTGWSDFMNRIKHLSEVGNSWVKPQTRTIEREAEAISSAPAGVAAAKPFLSRLRQGSDVTRT